MRLPRSSPFFSLPNRIAIAALIGFLATASTAAAAELKLLREVILKDAPIPAQAIVRTNDNGFIVAGNHGAIRTDSNGNIIWRYMPLAQEVTPISGKYRDVNYSGAVVMPDNSMFLCGYTNMKDTRKPRHGLLTHLNEDGTLIDEQEMLPQTKSDLATGYFLECVSDGDGIISVGTSLQNIKNVDATNPEVETNKRTTNYTTTYNYWIAAFDKKGKRKWEQLGPIDKGAWFLPLSLMRISNGRFVFAGAANMDNTQIVRFTSNGDIEKNSVVDGKFLLIQPTDDSAALQLVSTNAYIMTLIKLNSDLRQDARITGHPRRDDDDINVAYRLPDNSLVLFGSRGEHRTSYARIMAFDPSLSKENVLDLEQRTASSLWVDAATPTNKDGEFAAIRTSLHDNGLILDFVSVK